VAQDIDCTLCCIYIQYTTIYAKLGLNYYTISQIQHQ